MTQVLRPLALASAALLALCLPTLAVHQLQLLPPVISLGGRHVVEPHETEISAPQEPAKPLTKRMPSGIQQLADFVARTFRVPKDYAMHVIRHAIQAANRHGLEPTLVLGVIAQESSFRKEATSSAGAQGLMQVMPDIHADLTARMLRETETLYDVAPNVKTGTHILAGYLREAGGNLSKALHRYSGGANGYEEKVLRHKEQFDRFLPMDS